MALHALLCARQGAARPANAGWEGWPQHRGWGSWDFSASRWGVWAQNILRGHMGTGYQRHLQRLCANLKKMPSGSCLPPGLHATCRWPWRCTESRRTRAPGWGQAGGMREAVGPAGQGRMRPSESLLTIETHRAVVWSPGGPEPALVGSGRQSPSCPGGLGRSLRRQPGRGGGHRPSSQSDPAW